MNNGKKLQKKTKGKIKQELQFTSQLNNLFGLFMQRH